MNQELNESRTNEYCRVVSKQLEAIKLCGGDLLCKRAIKWAIQVIEVCKPGEQDDTTFQTLKLIAKNWASVPLSIRASSWPSDDDVEYIKELKGTPQHYTNPNVTPNDSIKVPQEVMVDTVDGHALTITWLDLKRMGLDGVEHLFAAPITDDFMVIRNTDRNPLLLYRNAKDTWKYFLSKSTKDNRSAYRFFFEAKKWQPPSLAKINTSGEFKYEDAKQNDLTKALLLSFSMHNQMRVNLSRLIRNGEIKLSVLRRRKIAVHQLSSQMTNLELMQQPRNYVSLLQIDKEIEHTLANLKCLKLDYLRYDGIQLEWDGTQTEDPSHLIRHSYSLRFDGLQPLWQPERKENVVSLKAMDKRPDWYHPTIFDRFRDRTKDVIHGTAKLNGLEKVKALLESGTKKDRDTTSSVESNDHEALKAVFDNFNTFITKYYSWQDALTDIHDTEYFLICVNWMIRLRSLGYPHVDFSWTTDEGVQFPGRRLEDERLFGPGIEKYDDKMQRTFNGSTTEKRLSIRYETSGLPRSFLDTSFEGPLPCENSVDNLINIDTLNNLLTVISLHTIPKITEKWFVSSASVSSLFEKVLDVLKSTAYDFNIGKFGSFADNKYNDDNVMTLLWKEATTRVPSDELDECLGVEAKASTIVYDVTYEDLLNTLEWVYGELMETKSTSSKRKDSGTSVVVFGFKANKSECTEAAKETADSTEPAAKMQKRPIDMLASILGAEEFDAEDIRAPRLPCGRAIRPIPLQ
jgi:hypothetical protein